MSEQLTMTSAELRALRKKKKEKRGTTGPGGAGSSPVARPEPEADATEGGEVGTILRASEEESEWGRRWRDESVFRVYYHHAGRVRTLCCDADALARVFARVHSAHSHSIHVFTAPDHD